MSMLTGQRLSLLEDAQLLPNRSWVTDQVADVSTQLQGQLDKLVDGQLALNEQLALMNNISGYGTAYIPFDFYRNANSMQTMPFNSRLGPNKNCVINGDGTITLAKGTWRLSTQVTTDQHDNLAGIMRIQVLYPSGDTVYSFKEIQKNIDAGKWNTFQGYHTVVCAEPGYRVRVQFQYNRGIGLNLLFRGGTHLSHLTVDRMDLRTDNAVVSENPPPERAGQTG